MPPLPPNTKPATIPAAKAHVQSWFPGQRLKARKMGKVTVVFAHGVDHGWQEHAVAHGFQLLPA